MRHEADKLVPKQMNSVDHMARLNVKYKGDFTVGNQTANLSLRIWISLHHRSSSSLGSSQMSS